MTHKRAALETILHDDSERVLLITRRLSLVDEVIKVNDDNAFEMARLLAKKEGVIAGTSSGAALYAATQLSEKIEKGNIVTILPDRGDRYFSKNIYD